jgi:hypothetical protein
MAPSIRRDLYSEVTSSILAELEAGAAQEANPSLDIARVPHIAIEGERQARILHCGE